MKNIKFCLLALLLFQQPLAFGALNLELTQGVDKALPIAVAPFQDLGNVQQGDTTINEVITQDLINSGRFVTLSDSAMGTHFPHSPSEVNIERWRNKDVDFLVLGSVKPTTGDKYQVTFSLMDVFEPTNKPLLSQSFDVKRSQLRRLSHHISNLIYKQLTNTQGIFATRIAYIVVDRNPTNHMKKRYSLMVADVDGENANTVVTSPYPMMSPAWAPDGKRLAYVSFEKRTAEIYIVNIFTGKRYRLTSFKGINSAPAWSADGSKLAVVLSRTGYPKLHLIDVATRKVRQLTYGLSIDTEPVWSPDNRYIYFTSDRGGAPQVYKLAVGSGRIKRVTFQGRYNASPTVSPNGRLLAFLHQDKGRFSIAVQDLKTGVMNILSARGTEKSPSFAPNGKMVLFANRLGNKGSLSMVSTDGAVKIRVPTQYTSVQEPTWSPL